MGTDILFNGGWEFMKLPPDAPTPDWSVPDNGAVWQPVAIPHDWLIYDTLHLYEDGDGWYRKRFFINEDEITEKRLFFNFDGVYMDCEIFINGISVFEWKYGYTAFSFECGAAVKPGENEMRVRVAYRSPNSRWYSGAGIYRDVHMIIKNKDCLPLNGIYITPVKLDETRWQVEIDAETDVRDGFSYTLTHILRDRDGREIARCEGGEHQSLTADNPLLWELEAPHLYFLTSELYVNGVQTDATINRFGFRTAEITANDGFFLNGRRLKLNGVCQHHDLGALGAAVNRDALARQFSLLREMGVNAIRTSHNPPAKAFMELAEEMGFLVLSELLDMWRLPKTTYDYARFFDAWIERDVAAWVRRDRNSPSVIMWSVGNEIYDTHAGEKGRETMNLLISLVERHDYKKHAPATLGSNYMPWPNTQACAEDIKLIGYNYAENLYAAHHAAHPSWIIYGSETGSTVQSRGVYHFPLAQSMLADDDLQCSALGNSSTSWGAPTVEACITADRDAPFSLGQFVWSGFDYIGEPTPYATKNAYFGHLDTAGFKKDSFYLFQSAWTDYRKAPMVHVYPFWDFSPGQRVDVRVCSNAPKVALLLNGRSLGTADIDHAHGRKLTGDWCIPYEAGVLEALAYDEHGKIIAREEKQSFGDAYRLQLQSEYNGLWFITITAADENGVPVENANNRVRITVTGGRLLGMDNGDSADFDPYKTDNRRMFNGKLLAIINPSGAPEAVSVTVESPGLISAVYTAGSPMACADAAVSPVNPGDDLPVRKIELSTSAGFALNQSQPETVISAVLKPANAAYKDIVWRLTDAAGIDSPLASLKVAEDNLSAVVTAKGDGVFYVRCGIKNGASHTALYNALALTVTGIGAARLDPYHFVAGGLCNQSNVPMTNGNERGVATPRDEESHVGFSGLDFGAYGADELTLPLFPLSGDPLPVEIWEGMPNEGGKKLCTATYDKGSIWNTYQDLTVKLPRRLSGITTLCFVLRRKVHIKGFVFKKLEKAYQLLHAAENDRIYGDRFTLNGTCVEKIGNNVSLTYQDMDFGEGGTEAVMINAASHNEKNSVLAVFTGDGAEIKIMLEIPGTAAYTAACYPLGQRITGRKTVSFIFLPGCDMDLAWFQFNPRNHS